MSSIIVLAEDEPTVGQAMQVALERAGYIVFWRRNGMDAWDSISVSNPDLVILDNRLPGLSGLEVLSKMKSEEQTRRIPVLMATSSGSQTDILAAMRSGAKDYVVKPFKLSHLVERVQRLLPN